MKFPMKKKNDFHNSLCIIHYALCTLKFLIKLKFSDKLNFLII